MSRFTYYLWACIFGLIGWVFIILAVKELGGF